MLAFRVDPRATPRTRALPCFCAIGSGAGTSSRPRLGAGGAAGAALAPVAVEVPFFGRGQVGEGEEVEVIGKWHRGTLRANKVINLSTTQPGDPSHRGPREGEIRAPTPSESAPTHRERGPEDARERLGPNGRDRPSLR